MIAEEEWYPGSYSIYKTLPWLYDKDLHVLMPWTVIAVSPFGFLVLRSAGGTLFKMLTKPIVMVGDVIS